MTTVIPFTSPLEENFTKTKMATPCTLVIFGATGDLTARKIVPALYNLSREGQLPAHFACVGFARRPKTHEQFREEMFDSVSNFSRSKPHDDNVWKDFSERLFYHQSNFDDDAGYESLNRELQELDESLDTRGNRVFYLSTPPKNFAPIIDKLHQHGLIYNPKEEKDKFSRVIIEKPFGHDLASALQLQQEISKYLDESQIYRIDHYLGKETVQNLMVFRFTNPLFESMWNRHHIDHVEITVSEELGIGTRGHFFEEAGILRDIVQNHMMQLLSIVAMEPPANLTADAIRDEKVKVLQSIRPLHPDEYDEQVIRGQYGPGYINGEAVCGYREEKDVDAKSNVETFVAMKLSIDNWRWAGVPFYLRAGKRLPKRATEIAITFKTVPLFIKQYNSDENPPNVLVIRIQPDEGIALNINCKVPGLQTLLQTVKMDFRYGNFFGSKPPEAYERLICDCMADDGTLFAHIDEVVASWRLFTPLLEYWQKRTATPFPNYAAGTWGPAAASELMRRDGYLWRLI